LLFGETVVDTCKAPPGALKLYLRPHKATDAYDGLLWAKALERYERNGKVGTPPAPSTDQETLIALAGVNALVADLRDIDSLRTALKSTFRLPVAAATPAGGDDDDEADYDDTAAPEVYDKGLMKQVCADGRVRTVFGIVETGRLSSSKPNMQNAAGAADDHFNRILGWGDYAEDDTPEAAVTFNTREIFCTEPGWFLIDTDLKGAEINAAAWNSDDTVLLDHARRNNLDEKDPEWLDLHSDLAANAFGLTCSLAEVKKLYKVLRTAAKRARFGHYYGASPETILRKAQEDDPNVTLEQVVRIVKGHDVLYPTLADFFASCRTRVGSHGWMCNGFGGYRRFRHTTERDLRAAQEREAQNWSCQGLVADAGHVALGNIWRELRTRKMRARLVLSVHDSFMVECPAAEAAAVVDEVLPQAICEMTTVVPTDLDGTPTGKGPYHFGIDTTVCRSWGKAVPEEEWRAECAAARDAIPAY
jgi:hypothetical protein